MLELLVTVTDKYGTQVLLNPKYIVGITLHNNNYTINMLGNVLYEVTNESYEKLLKYFNILK